MYTAPINCKKKWRTRGFLSSWYYVPVHTCVCVSVSVSALSGWRSQVKQEHLQQCTSSGDAKVIAIEKLPKKKNGIFPAYIIQHWNIILFSHSHPPRREEIFLNTTSVSNPLRKGQTHLLPSPLTLKYVFFLLFLI